MLHGPAHKHALIPGPHVVPADRCPLVARAEFLEEEFSVFERLVVRAHIASRRSDDYSNIGAGMHTPERVRWSFFVGGGNADNLMTRWRKQGALRAGSK
ncbi:hypothetical protein D3C73_1240110 [compost metagenome]